VRATLPSSDVPSGQVVTGPDKNGGSTHDEVRQRVETLRRAFVGSVFAERGDRIDLTREELSHAKVYSGASGVNLGLADDVGGIDTAIAAAADEAGLADYGVTRMDARSRRSSPNSASPQATERPRSRRRSGSSTTAASTRSSTSCYTARFEPRTRR